MPERESGLNLNDVKVVGRLVVVDVRLSQDGDTALGTETLPLAQDDSKARPATVRARTRELVLGRRFNHLPAVEIE